MPSVTMRTKLRWQTCCTGEVENPVAVACPLKYFHASISRWALGVAPPAERPLMTLVREARLVVVMSWIGNW